MDNPLIQELKIAFPNDVLFDNFRDDIALQALIVFKSKGVTITDLKDFSKLVPTIYPWTKSRNPTNCNCNNYDRLRYNVNRRFVYFPLMIVMVETEDHVSLAIKWAKKYNIQVSTRSGSHCYEPFSIIGQMVIDQSRRTKVNVHRKDDRNYAIIEAGALIGPTQFELSKYKLALVAGTCPNVGVAGLTLGGGIGFLTRKYGLALDNLIAVEMITAKGEVIKCDKDQNSDLFWALRGAGNGNYGIVTRLVFNVYPIDKVTIFEFRFPFKYVKEVIDTWQRWASTTIDKLTTEIDVLNDSIIFTGQYIGSKKSLMKKLLKSDILNYQYTSHFIKEVSFADACRNFAGLGYYPPFFKCHSSFAKEYLPLDALSVIETWMKNAEPNVKLELDAFGGKVNKIAPNATAFPHRDSLFWVQLQSHWSKQEENESRLVWAQEFFDKLKPYLEGAYINCPDLSLLHPLIQYYDDNLDKLIRIKRKYDPDNFFKYEQSIPI